MGCDGGMCWNVSDGYMLYVSAVRGVWLMCLCGWCLLCVRLVWVCCLAGMYSCYWSTYVYVSVCIYTRHMCICVWYIYMACVSYGCPWSVWVMHGPCMCLLRLTQSAPSQDQVFKVPLVSAAKCVCTEPVPGWLFNNKWVLFG